MQKQGKKGSVVEQDLSVVTSLRKQTAFQTMI